MFSVMWKELCPSFQPEEVLSPGILKGGQHLINRSALLQLQQFRTFCEVPFLINHAGLTLRGQRTWREHETLLKQGAAELSCHVVGCAWDITPKGLSLPLFAEMADQWGMGGVGLYVSQGFVHCDLRRSFTMPGEQRRKGETVKWTVP